MSAAPAQGLEEAVEALRDMVGVVEAFHSFCKDPKRPCGEYGVECPISMGEWIDADDTTKLERARALLALTRGDGRELGAATPQTAQHRGCSGDGKTPTKLPVRIAPERWKRCPSTHCERRGECASPNECTVKS